MTQLLRPFLADESGATAIEYALLASLIAVIIVSAVRGLGVNLTGLFQSVGSGFASR